MAERSSRTNKHNDPKAPSLGPRQQKMGGEGLLHTCSAAYIPFLSNLLLFSSLLAGGPGATWTLPSQVWPMSQNERSLKMCQQKVESRNLLAVCSSKPSKKPVLNWAEGAGAWQFWHKTVTSPLLPKCVLLEGWDRSSLPFQLFRDRHSNMFEVTGSGKPDFILDWFFQ